ncbi:hypothetical protein BD770DRAFT_427507 [Pilaira anomala]|nr:hypothetical protein BD770DRAFT_427507 [Pilaira anomala]
MSTSKETNQSNTDESKDLVSVTELTELSDYDEELIANNPSLLDNLNVESATASEEYVKHKNALEQVKSKQDQISKEILQHLDKTAYKIVEQFEKGIQAIRLTNDDESHNQTVQANVKLRQEVQDLKEILSLEKTELWNTRSKLSALEKEKKEEDNYRKKLTDSKLFKEKLECHFEQLLIAYKIGQATKKLNENSRSDINFGTIDKEITDVTIRQIREAIKDILIKSELETAKVMLEATKVELEAAKKERDDLQEELQNKASKRNSYQSLSSTRFRRRGKKFYG